MPSVCNEERTLRKRGKGGERVMYNTVLYRVIHRIDAYIR